MQIDVDNITNFSQNDIKNACDKIDIILSGLVLSENNIYLTKSGKGGNDAYFIYTLTKKHRLIETGKNIAVNNDCIEYNIDFINTSLISEIRKKFDEVISEKIKQTHFVYKDVLQNPIDENVKRLINCNLLVKSIVNYIEERLSVDNLDFENLSSLLGIPRICSDDDVKKYHKFLFERYEKLLDKNIVDDFNKKISLFEPYEIVYAVRIQIGIDNIISSHIDELIPEISNAAIGLFAGKVID